MKYKVLKGCSVAGKRLVEGEVVSIPEDKVRQLVAMRRIEEAKESPKTKAKPKPKAKVDDE